MKFRFLNKTFENRQFDYTPMYYDERKENLEQKKDQYRKLKTNKLSDEDRKHMLKARMHSEWSGAEFRNAARKNANMRTIVLIVLIVALGYFIFNGVDEVDTVVKKVW